MSTTTKASETCFKSPVRERVALLFKLTLPALMVGAVHAAEPREPAEVYDQVCAHCHSPDKAVGPEITQKVPESARGSWEDYIHTMVREGRAAMPAFSQSEISDAELDALAEALASGKLADDRKGE